MIHHLVCFRFKPGTTDAALAEAAAALRGMVGRIPEVRAVRFGRNHAPSAGEYTHVLTVDLDDMAAVNRYLEHPVHVEVVQRHIAPIRDARLAIDIDA